MIKPSPSIDYHQYPNIFIERHIPIGKRLIVLGESSKGELYQPTPIYSSRMAKDVFGEGELLKAYDDIITFDANINLFMMRIESFGFEEAFRLLEAFQFDLMYIHGVHFNNAVSLYESFVRFAKIKEEKGSLIHLVMSLSHELGYPEISNLFSTVRGFTNDIDSEDPEELGKYLSIVVNHIKDKDAGAVYAGMLAALEPEISPVNKTIEVELTFEFSKSEILKLREIGFVCFKNSLKKGVVCTSSSCAVSTAGSVHKHISNFRIAQYLINEIASDLQKFIGRTGVWFQTLHIEDLIDDKLREYIKLQRIRDYVFQVSYDELAGNIYVEIEVVPIFSVYKMQTHTTVRVFK